MGHENLNKIDKTLKRKAPKAWRSWRTRKRRQAISGMFATDILTDNLELLRELVEIDSQYDNTAGVKAVSEIVATQLSDLGFEISWIPCQTGRFAPLMIATLKGQIDECITFVGHSDTVNSPYENPAFKVSADGRVGFGSGVIDDKGGVVVGLSAIKLLLSGYQPKMTLRFICSPNEEIGSIGFTDIFREYGKDTRLALGLEPALENGSIINCRRGNRWYNLNIEGQEAHAGRSYGEHANAAHDLAIKIAKMQKLTNYKKLRSLTVGHIEGGRGKHNIVCGKVSAKLDLRFATIKCRERMHIALEKILMNPIEVSTCGKYSTVTNYEIVDDCPPFSPNIISIKYSLRYVRILKSIERRKVKAEISGGAGDVNYLSHGKNIVLDGLGACGAGMHTEGESIDLDSLRSRPLALARFIKYFDSKQSLR